MPTLLPAFARARRVGSALAVAALVGLVALVLALPGAAAPAAAQVMHPAWHTLPLVDARTGQGFTLADFAGKTVYVEPMATWCSNCRQQMSIIRDEVRAKVDPTQVVFVGLSVETTLSAETLAQYTATNNFDWTFAVMTPDMLQELANTFGRTVTNPPAVPHFVISPDGTVSELQTGYRTADQLLKVLSEAGMMQPSMGAPMMQPTTTP